MKSGGASIAPHGQSVRRHGTGRLESGALAVELVEAPLAPIIDGGLERAGVASDGVVVDCPQGIVVRADPDRLAQVVGNFVRNAARHGDPPIVVVAGELGDAVEIRVRDHGRGVEAERVDSLFERAAPAVPCRGGTGLGLFIARGLARSMGGDAWYEPASPGAAFGVRVPGAVLG